MDFNYIIEKINQSKFKKKPFKHIYIENFFNEIDFEKITSEPEIKLKKCSDDEELFKELFKNNYKLIDFPGCTKNYREYIEKHSKGIKLKHYNNSCETEGVTLRLEPKSPILSLLNDFLAKEEFNKAIAEKFNINLSSCIIDRGIQKYLDGYEISPHPDIRKKAATYMININPSDENEKLDHHTHYLKLKPKYEYVKEFWKGNEDAERLWVPWDWCTTEFVQKKNNSIVIFAPSNDTMHGVKANYKHYSTQRTQLYGNLWYLKSETKYAPKWEQFVIKNLEASNKKIDQKETNFSKIQERLFGKKK